MSPANYFKVREKVKFFFFLKREKTGRKGRKEEGKEGRGIH